MIDIILLLISVASLLTNVWLVRKFDHSKPEQVIRFVELRQPEDPDPVDAQVEPEPVSVQVDARPKVQAWVNQRGIPMAAYNDSPQAPQATPKVAPLARPYGFAGGGPPAN